MLSGAVPIHLTKALSYHLDPITDTEMLVVVEQVRSLNKSIKTLDKAIEDHGSKMDGFKNLKSIKGIGSKGGGNFAGDHLGYPELPFFKAACCLYRNCPGGKQFQ